MELHSTLDNPVPSGAECHALATPAGDLRYALLRNPSATRGTVIVHPGWAEFIEKYFETMGDLAARGFHVAVLDPRGQGRSVREVPDGISHVQSYDDYVADLVALRGAVLRQLPGPVTLLGHSMGGAVSILTVMTIPDFAERVVLSAPFAGFGISSGMAEWQLKLVSSLLLPLGYRKKLAPGVDKNARRLQPFEGNPLTSDRARYERWLDVQRAAPDLFTGMPTVGWVAETLKAHGRIFAPGAIEHIRVPVLVTDATLDKVVSRAALARFAARLPHGRMVSIEGSEHEALQERDPIRNAWWAAFDSFMA